MEPFVYPYVVERDDNDTWLIRFPDVPEVVTYAEDESQIGLVAQDALWTVLDAFIRTRRPLPVPSKGQNVVDLGPRVSAKLALHQAMITAGVSQAELARRLEVSPTQTNRLLDLDHPSTLDQITDALAAVRHRLRVFAVREPIAVREVKPGRRFPGARRDVTAPARRARHR
jgi:antitoxin HicB